MSAPRGYGPHPGLVGVEGSPPLSPEVHGSERYLTISVDDGHPTDSRTAELLSAYGLQATFYVPVKNPERPTLAPGALRTIAEAFEVGAHTFSHRSLARLPDREAMKEISEGKYWLEQLLGKPVVAFCYPRGKFTRRTPAIVREAGLSGARTCMLNLNTIPADPYVAGVSTHATSHARHIQIRHALLEGNLRGVYNFISTHRLARDWAHHFAAALHWVSRHGGVAHLYLHSWEIEQHDEWQKLEAVLEHTAGYTHLKRVTNGELFRRCHESAQERQRLNDPFRPRPA
jgi:peptidoglycan/xylan/chitin deacetylase (PgdA/CDA1 family)